MSPDPDALQRGREAYREHAWGEAYAALSAADTLATLATADLELLATSAYLVGKDELAVDQWVRAHNACVRAGDKRRAARCAFWLTMALLSLGERARAGGWLATAQRLLGEEKQDCAEQGLLLVVVGRSQIGQGDVSTGRDTFRRAAEFGDRFDDTDLKVFGRLGQGQAHAITGDHGAAAALFDEAMVAVTVGDVSPIAVGIVYCAVIEACYDLLDLGRAREWTAALSRWCSSQPDLVAFRGQCLIHRAETMRLVGDWSSAIGEAEHVCGAVSRTGSAPAFDSADRHAFRRHHVGAAFYEVAEVHRIRGQFAAAEEAYRQASQHGRSPEPGLALLRLAQGRVKAAHAAIRRALEEPQKRFARANVLAACVEIMIAVPDLAAARAASDELAKLAPDLSSPFLRALSAQALGNVLLAEGDPRTALASLRGAWMEWQDLEVPYEAARARVMRGLACRQLGDEEAAQMEFDAACRVFVRLGAAPDVSRVEALRPSAPAAAGGPLTSRELQVIRLLAAGYTNRAIARELGISERTVDRHVSNILTKLDLSSRSAATAYAYQHGLV